MKKILCILLTVVIAFSLSITVFAASVLPDEYPGNDQNSYTPPEGCIRTTLPNSALVGTHVYTFNDYGQLDSEGTNTFTLVVNSAGAYTQVASWTWSGSYPLYSVIVKGGNAYNEYVYSGTATSDTILVSPVNTSGHPAGISHVSVVLCPDELPPVPPDDNSICCIIICILLIVIICLLIVVIIEVVSIKCIICRKKHHCCQDYPDD